MSSDTISVLASIGSGETLADRVDRPKNRVGCAEFLLFPVDIAVCSCGFGVRLLRVGLLIGVRRLSVLRAGDSGLEALDDGTLDGVETSRGAIVSWGAGTTAGRRTDLRPVVKQSTGGVSASSGASEMSLLSGIGGDLDLDLRGVTEVRFPSTDSCDTTSTRPNTSPVSMGLYWK